MNRRNLMKATAATALFLGLGLSIRKPHAGSFEITKSDAEWKAILTPEQFAVMRQEDTERPFTSALLDEHRKGTFDCAACDLPLYASETNCRMLSARRKTTRCSRRGPKFTAAAAAVTWGMCSRTAPSPLACATA